MNTTLEHNAPTDIYHPTLIYCPMCEEMHANNTLCQMDLGDFHA